jgi:hypothetical protein
VTRWVLLLAACGGSSRPLENHATSGDKPSAARFTAMSAAQQCAATEPRGVACCEAFADRADPEPCAPTDVHKLHELRCVTEIHYARDLYACWDEPCKSIAVCMLQVRIDRRLPRVN